MSRTEGRSSCTGQGRQRYERAQALVQSELAAMRPTISQHVLKEMKLAGVKADLETMKNMHKKRQAELVSPLLPSTLLSSPLTLPPAQLLPQRTPQKAQRQLPPPTRPPQHRPGAHLPRPHAPHLPPLHRAHAARDGVLPVDRLPGAPGLVDDRARRARRGDVRDGGDKELDDDGGGEGAAGQGADAEEAARGGGEGGVQYSGEHEECDQACGAPAYHCDELCTGGKCSAQVQLGYS